MDQIQIVAYRNSTREWGDTEHLDTSDQCKEWADKRKAWAHSFRCYADNWDYFEEGIVCGNDIEWTAIGMKKSA